MAWTDPSSINFNTGQVITETKLEQVTDNLLALVRSGDSTGLAPTTTAAEITSTASEMSMRTAAAAGNTTGWLIPAGLIGTTRMVRLVAHGDWLYNANQSLRIRIYLRDGSGTNTLLWDDTAGGSAGTVATRGPWSMEVNVAALGSSSQIMWGHLLMRKSSAPTSGIGDFPNIDTGGSFTNGALFADDSASSVDMSAARYLDVTVTWGASSASLAWRLKYAALQVF